MVLQTDVHMDIWTDIRTDLNFIVIENRVAIFFATAMSGYPALAISRISGIRPKN